MHWKLGKVYRKLVSIKLKLQIELILLKKGEKFSFPIETPFLSPLLSNANYKVIIIIITIIFEILNKNNNEKKSRDIEGSHPSHSTRPNLLVKCWKR